MPAHSIKNTRSHACALHKKTCAVMPAHSITNTVGGRSCITIENRTPVDPFRPLNNSDNNSFSTLISYPAIASSPLVFETFLTASIYQTGAVAAHQLFTAVYGLNPLESMGCAVLQPKIESRSASTLTWFLMYHVKFVFLSTTDK